MAATASDTAPDEHRRVEPETITRSTPGFTAVNGRPSASPPEKNKSHPEQTKEASENSTYRAIQPNNHQDRAPTPSSSRPARPETQLEQRASPPPSSMDRSYQTPRSQGPSDEPRPQSVNGQTRSDSINQSNHVNSSPQKRKRSDSDEYNNPDSSAFHSHSLPPPPPDQRMYPAETNGRPRESEPRSPPQSYPRPSPLHPYGRPDHAPPHGSYPQPERHQLVRNEYDHSFDPHMNPAQQRQPYYPDPHDAHLAHELSRDLQRDNNNYEPPLPGREQFMTPEEEDHHYGEYNPNMSAAQREMDRKRRKRVFSNRTKTGCMTCRRRKKKCDEQHPECNNCLRGGFVCEGYTIRNTWQKPSNAKAPIPLQQKGYPPPNIHRPGPYPPPYAHEQSPDHYPPPPPHMASHHHPTSDGDRIKPIVVEEDRDHYGRPSPPNMQSKPAWMKSGRPYPSHDMPYESHDSGSMQPPPRAHRSNSSHSQYSGPSSQAQSQSNAQSVAERALSTSLRPSPGRRDTQLTEREKMLKGNYYHPFSPALMEDRERCLAATWRFNNATNPSHGASPEERSRLFRAILSLKPSPEPPLLTNGSEGPPPQPTMPLPFGTCGERVVVEAPFHCDYGYNITIGDDVLIGPDCRISDTCSVTIGARCIFSPNVKLVCATYPIDPRRRNGSGGQALGRNIVIEEDCWIGSNVTILAGVRVGKSSTVGAGSLLHQDVPRFTVVAGNPAKVSRGIYDGNADGS